MKHLQGKIALVTGATRGIGKGIAIGLGESGATVYITGRTLEPTNDSLGGSLQETQTAVIEAGGVCIPIQVNHSDDQQICRLFERIEREQNGQLDILVNNVYAGVQSIREAYGKTFWELEPSFWDAANNVGLRSHYVASIYAARMMTKRKQGIIFTISSWGGMSYIFNVPYGVGKSACDRLAADMAKELKQYNVTSLAIYPGIVGTEQITNFAKEQSSENGNSSLFADGYNWETPLFTGRAIASLATDANIIKYTGKIQIVAEVAKKYGIVDQNGNRPVSLRSLRFILAMAIPFLRNYAWLIPDLTIPWLVIFFLMISSRF
ncbi:SDR family NAD(P)-dependent oxidoreductase [Aphanizomenon flos-aquae NRERC-008]|uniref:SDR family NAD(P)-dependent oxidoreductase n=1 Tax=Aphanizomenon flos-aquae FACHB-1249 TaxID=2692889 RepID=A0ABR8IQY8_APHFL|nr:MULTISPECIES: SDR family NAD(P)-dependent oxidoreductase [Aphanizomenon]MBD2390142.1 SDR family NAD(P)-dependent oxidoreductase [Aphanizomenon flos-aquae FACHB-1171]MBD2556564.1 SDR family NAD(P)-dependent oxidoreductase [Aphanizomenon flos-aquae FACHB-1290]MBD2631144.1 SDR family NAD(P)-dependent oxidoreductase [Aphanizomenon sp. FACHB-1399]MBD2657020.1 SDR family NAD(P)-dependent oxidoreductase [Aphanizomenon flos-aquae FACHB-1265]MBD2672557.1 SDR family NAD(P)-dependent oxidoreductase [A